MKNVNVYVWYSKASEDSGKVLAKILGTEQHGTLPPKDFNGVLVCYGATPTDRFKWEDRTVRFIFNDPRNVRKFVDRYALFAELGRAGFIVPPLVKITKDSTFDQVCEDLVVNPLMGLSVFKSNGSDAKPAHTELGFNQAKAAGMVYASTTEFINAKRTRCFVVDGAFVGSIAQSNGNTELFAKAAAEEQTVVPDKAAAASLISALVNAGVVQPVKNYWLAQATANPAMVDTAVRVAKALGLDFCAVDMVNVIDGSAKVLNVVSTPNIVEQEDIHGPLGDAVKLWLKRAHRTAKEILSDIATEANEEEAEAIVNELRKIKNEAVKAV